MNEVGNAGLKPRNIANKILYRNAARVRDYNLDPDTLDWVHDLSVSAIPTQPSVDNPASSPAPEAETGSGGVVHVGGYDHEPE